MAFAFSTKDYAIMAEKVKEVMMKKKWLSVITAVRVCNR
jgi:hypothetical protein